jgi:hypothetical protein
MPTKSDLDHFRGEIGESIVAYELMKRNWDVMKHLGGQGSDLLAARDRIQRRIEAKTTDPFLKKGKHRRQLTVKLSDVEREAADFLVFYMHGYDTFCVMPKRSFPSSGSVTVFIDRENKISNGTVYEEDRNFWSPLE